MQKTNLVTLSYRLLRILLHTLIGLAIIATAWPFTKQSTRLQHIKWWSRKLLRCFNMNIITFGELPKDGISNTMFLANHVSWIDIHALNSIIPLQFIAKSDINNWPIFGYLARKSGTIFINRNSRKDTSRIVEMTVMCLKTGGNVGFFPEGTTTDGTELKHFKSSIVQAAINTGAKLQPVAIRYPTADGGINTKIAYAGETSLGESVMNILKQKKSVIEIHFLRPIEIASQNRQSLTKTAYERIAETLKL